MILFLVVAYIYEEIRGDESDCYVQQSTAVLSTSSRHFSNGITEITQNTNTQFL